MPIRKRNKKKSSDIGKANMDIVAAYPAYGIATFTRKNGEKSKK